LEAPEKSVKNLQSRGGLLFAAKRLPFAKRERSIEPEEIA
jgi:hypothetical protein